MIAPARRIIEPFAGKGDILAWLARKCSSAPVEAYDIAPRAEHIIARDTLMIPPDYTNAIVITNPPYVARNKCARKEIFDKYGLNDLYKCFIHTLICGGAYGGAIIIPAGFFFSSRDCKLRARFMNTYKILFVRYFEEAVFANTSITVCTVVFQKIDSAARDDAHGGDANAQLVKWIRMPQRKTRVFEMRADYDWIIGGEIAYLAYDPQITVARYVQDRAIPAGTALTSITLCALDSGKLNGATIGLSYQAGYCYPAKESSRTRATLCIGREDGPWEMNEAAQVDLVRRFNLFITEWRERWWSLFLPPYRESKDFARKRMPFEMAYLIVKHLLSSQ